MRIKFEELLAKEEISMNELPTDIIREIKAFRMRIGLIKNLPEDDSKVIAIMSKDDKICDQINAWLDDVVEEEEESTGDAKKTTPVASAKEPVFAARAVAAPIVAAAPPVNQVNDDALIAKIKEKLKGKRIHERELTTILGSKPNQPYHKLNGMILKRVFLGDGQYEVC
jgi:hypothetical protein